MRSLILPGIGVIRRRDPRLALYPFALDDGSAGVFRNLMTNVDATTSGGSTLTGAAKRRNDFQRLTSTFPSLGYRASPAWTNLLYALDNNCTSFENPANTGTWTPTRCTLTNVNTDASHGSRCCRVYVTEAAAGYNIRVQRDITAAVAASNQYTAAVMVKAGSASAIGKQYSVRLAGDVSGNTIGTAIALSNDWQLFSVTKTFGAGDSVMTYFVDNRNNTEIGDIVLVDAISLVAGATVPQFEEKKCTITEAYFANPVPAGAPVSGIVFLWVPYNGNDNTEHNYLDCRDATPLGWRLYKSAANNLLIETTAAAGIKSMGGAVDNINMPRGTMHRVAFSIHEDNTQHLALNGTLLTTSAGAAGREAAVNANLYVGSDKDGANHGNCLLLPYVYEVPWSAAECEYYSTLQAPPPRTRMVA